MNRRGFLARLGFGTVAAAAAATGAVDIERLLWTPGERTIFLPPISGNTVMPADWMAQELLRGFEKNLTFSAHINRDYERFFVGKKVNVRLPKRFR